MARVRFFCELFHPERTSTGAIVSAIARHVASEHEVEVIAGQPSYSAHGTLAPEEESWEGIRIHRPGRHAHDTHSRFGRVRNMVDYIGFSLRYLRELPPGCVAILTTNPPLLVLAARLLGRKRSGRRVLVVHDIAPDVYAVAARPA